MQYVQQLVYVPGSHNLGLVMNEKCAFCSAPAVSICNYQMAHFRGCHKPFCRSHGQPHFDSDMLDLDASFGKSKGSKTKDVEQLRKAEEVFRARQHVPARIAEIRYCQECTDSYKHARVN